MACEHNHSEIVKLLMSHISFEKTTFKFSHNQYKKQLLFNKCMYILIVHGHIELLIWFYENYDLECQLNNYFALACAISRHKHVDKWLTDTRKTIELTTADSN